LTVKTVALISVMLNILYMCSFSFIYETTLWWYSGKTMPVMERNIPAGKSILFEFFGDFTASEFK
jgi:hypothetical protein